MSDPRYILAKYVPDLSRMEPRNIGLFLWHKGRFQARFLEAENAPFITDKATFVRWVDYWVKMTDGQEIAVPGRPPVPKKDEACIDALLEAQEGEYLLVDAGFVPQNLTVKEMPQAVDFLFSELVAIHESLTARETATTLKIRCKRIFDRTGLSQHSDFKAKYPVKCPVYGVQRHLHFHYGLGNGTPTALFQRVALSREQSVNSSAFMFRALTENAMLQKNRCAALVQKSEINNEASEEGHQLLAQVCTVIDVDQESRAEEELTDIAGSQ